MKDFASELTALVQPGAGTVDGAGYGAKPAELTQEEIANLRRDMDSAEITRKKDATNNTEVIAVLANRPNAAKWIIDKMGITEAEATTEQFRGQKFPIHVQEKPRVSWDGVKLKDVSGSEIILRKDQLVSWMLENTLGSIAGGTEGKAFQLVQRTRRSESAMTSVPTVIAKPIGIDASNPDHYIETFEPSIDPATGQPLTREVTVSLDHKYPRPKKGSSEMTEARVRGQVSGFPVFKRKDEYAKLGALRDTSNNPRALRVESDAEVNEAVNQLIQLRHWVTMRTV